MSRLARAVLGLAIVWMVGLALVMLARAGFAVTSNAYAEHLADLSP